MSNEADIHGLTGHLFRENFGKMVSHLSGKYGYHQIENILDAVQEAFEAALTSWKFSGVPENPFGWLYRVARNKLVNKLRHLNAEVSLMPEQGYSEEEYSNRELEDSLLRLLVFFSRTSFSERNKLIISLYYLCGFGYREISHALLMKTDAVKKVVLRSRETIKTLNDSWYASPLNPDQADYDHLLTIVYLLFNEGYKTSGKNGSIRHELCYEAMRLGRLILNYRTGEPEINALMALMFFNTSRFPARTSARTWISLEDQDRSLWSRELIAEGHHYLQKAKNNRHHLSRYYLEALISSIHCLSDSYAQTDWKTLAVLYRRLDARSVTVELNRLVAESHFRPLDELISETEKLPVTAETAFAFFCTRAYLFSRLKQWDAAIENYTQALLHTSNRTDRTWLNDKITQATEAAGRR